MEPTGKAKLHRVHRRNFSRHLPLSCVAQLGAFTLFVATPWLCTRSAAPTAPKVSGLKVSIDQKSGDYGITAPGIAGAVLSAGPAILLDGKWIPLSVLRKLYHDNAVHGYRALPLPACTSERHAVLGGPVTIRLPLAHNISRG